MAARLKHTRNFFLKAILELVLDDNLALSFCDEVDLVVGFVNLLILKAKRAFGSLEHGVHALDDIVYDILVVDLAVRSSAEKAACDGVHLNRIFENLD